VATIRDYQPGDFERLFALDQACFDPALAYSRAELHFYIRHPTTFTVVAEDEVKIVGFLVAHRRRGGVGHVITLDVDESVRRKKIGTQLMDFAERRLQEQGCSAVTLETAVINRAAISFYLRRGYSITHTVRGYYASGLDALEMRKDFRQKA
jgi:ribosomal-protein-alanine N-acetyltransferase